MTAPRLSITIDCRDPKVLVDFWSTALGYVMEEPPGAHTSWLGYWRSIGIPDSDLVGVDDSTCDSIVDPDGIRPRIWFQVVPEHKVTKNRVHLDLDVTDGRQWPLEERLAAVNAEVERLLACGASRLRILAPADADYYAVVMADPEGNEFCLS